MAKITYGFHASPFGEIVIGKTEKGLCWLGFKKRGRNGPGLESMKRHYRNAEFVRNDKETKTLSDHVLQAWKSGKEASVKLDLQGTEFQKAVWKAMLKIRKGSTSTYSDLARAVKRPDAVRAVGSAVGANPVSLIIPCHRVLPRGGGIGHYAGGAALKAKLLAAESVKITNQAHRA